MLNIFYIKYADSLWVQSFNVCPASSSNASVGEVGEISVFSAAAQSKGGPVWDSEMSVQLKRLWTFPLKIPFSHLWCFALLYKPP